MTLGPRLPCAVLPLLLAGGLIVTVAIAFGTFGSTAQVLVVIDGAGEEIISTEVDQDTEIVLEYTHSVERTTVRDVYAPMDGRLVLVRMEFSSYGAGLPSEADVAVRDGVYIYEPANVGLKTLRVQTGMTADHDLVVGDDRYDIAGRTGGGAVELSIQERRRIFT